MLLFIHILGSIFLGLFVLYSTWQSARQQNTNYSAYALAIAFGSLFQFVTGVMLAFAAPEASLSSLCTKFGAYLAVIVAAESYLFIKSQHHFPKTAVTGMLCICLVLASTTILLK